MPSCLSVLLETAVTPSSKSSPVVLRSQSVPNGADRHRRSLLSPQRRYTAAVPPHNDDESLNHPLSVSVTESNNRMKSESYLKYAGAWSVQQ